MEKFKDVIAGNTPVLVDFYATWCQPCRAMHPVLEEVKKTLGDKIRIIKIDIDRYQAGAEEYRICLLHSILFCRVFEQTKTT